MKNQRFYFYTRSGENELSLSESGLGSPLVIVAVGSKDQVTVAESETRQSGRLPCPPFLFFFSSTFHSSPPGSGPGVGARGHPAARPGASDPPAARANALRPLSGRVRSGARLLLSHSPRPRAHHLRPPDSRRPRGRPPLPPARPQVGLGLTPLASPDAPGPPPHAALPPRGHPEPGHPGCRRRGTGAWGPEARGGAQGAPEAHPAAATTRLRARPGLRKGAPPSGPDGPVPAVPDPHPSPLTRGPRGRGPRERLPGV